MDGANWANTALTMQWSRFREAQDILLKRPEALHVFRWHGTASSGDEAFQLCLAQEIGLCLFVAPMAVYDVAICPSLVFHMLAGVPFFQVALSLSGVGIAQVVDLACVPLRDLPPD
jgi:hypothetical protein